MKILTHNHAFAQVECAFLAHTFVHFDCILFKYTHSDVVLGEAPSPRAHRSVVLYMTGARWAKATKPKIKARRVYAVYSKKTDKQTSLSACDIALSGRISTECTRT
jgi:hypothetical protein